MRRYISILLNNTEILFAKYEYFLFIFYHSTFSFYRTIYLIDVLFY